MNRASQNEMIGRRTEMLTLYRSGMKPSEWISVVAAKFDVSEDAIKKDWGNRRKWINQFMKIDDSHELALGMLQDYEVSIWDSYHIYEQAEDVKTKIQAMWLRLKIIKEKQNFLKEINALEYIKIDYRNQSNKHYRETDPNPLTRMTPY